LEGRESGLSPARGWRRNGRHPQRPRDRLGERQHERAQPEQRLYVDDPPQRLGRLRDLRSSPPEAALHDRGPHMRASSFSPQRFIELSRYLDGRAEDSYREGGAWGGL